ncbi:MAG: helix-hairpin-helix domain-containing protein [Bacteroidota bacterium]
MRWLYRLQNRIGLAAPEGTAALAILVALAAGTVARHVQASAAPVAPDLYASSDAAFEAAERSATADAVPIRPVVSTTVSMPEPAEAVELADSAEVAPEPVVEPAPAPARRSARPAPARTGINTASAAELDRLPGIGPALASRILAYRQQHGRFSRPEQLIEVKGIGPKTFEKMKPWVVVD